MFDYKFYQMSSYNDCSYNVVQSFSRAVDTATLPGSHDVV
jgi:hypothetical protein